MVKIISYSIVTKDDGTLFTSLKVQGGVEAVQSQQTGKFYLTAKTANVPSTFDEETAKSLIGSNITGRVERVGCESYDYTIKTTGEVLTLNHRYEYVSENSFIQSSEVKVIEIAELELG